jgi:hypothetical protein
MTTELNASMTHEDITSFVDKIIQDRHGEKTDAQSLAADHDKPVGDLSAESDSGSEANTAEVEDQGEDTGNEEQQQAPKWLTAGLKAEATTYGISEEELSDFASREEFERALRLLDKRAAALAKGKEEEPAEKSGPARDARGRYVKDDSQEGSKEEPKEEPSFEGRYEVAISKDRWEDEIVDEFTRMRDYYESRISGLESRVSSLDTEAEEQRFDLALDSLGHSDLFGKTGRESARELQRRNDVFLAAKAQQAGLLQLGRKVSLGDPVFVERMARGTLVEEFQKKDLKSHTRKIAKQADGRMGGGSGRSTDVPEDAREFARRRYKELESG